jgi:hypothetical protein
VENKYERNSRRLNEKLGLALTNVKVNEEHKELNGFDMQKEVKLRLEQARKILNPNWLIAAQAEAVQVNLRHLLDEITRVHGEVADGGIPSDIPKHMPRSQNFFDPTDDSHNETQGLLVDL